MGAALLGEAAHPFSGHWCGGECNISAGKYSGSGSLMEAIFFLTAHMLGELDLDLGLDFLSADLCWLGGETGETSSVTLLSADLCWLGGEIGETSSGETWLRLPGDKQSTGETERELGECSATRGIAASPTRLPCKALRGELVLTGDTERSAEDL